MVQFNWEKRAYNFTPKTDREKRAYNFTPKTDPFYSTKNYAINISSVGDKIFSK